MKHSFITHFINLLKSIVPVIAVVFVSVILLYLILSIIRKIQSIRYSVKQKNVYLELTPPAFMDRMPESTAQLFSVLHNLLISRSFLDRIRQRRLCMSLEITSSKKSGIRYQVICPENKVQAVKQTIHAYLPEVQIKEIHGGNKAILYSENMKLVKFRQMLHFAYPLKSHELLDVTDPISYLTNAMTQLDANEMVIFQLVLVPVRVGEASVISKKILRNEDLSDHLDKKKLSVGPIILSWVNKFFIGLLNGATEVFHGQSSSSSRTAQSDMRYLHEVASKLKPARSLSQFEQQQMDSISAKVNQPLFDVSIRALVVADNKTEVSSRVKAIESAMTAYSVVGYQTLVGRHAKLPTTTKYNRYVFSRNLPDLIGKHSNILSATEIASMYHFPHSSSAKTENVVKALSKTLPAPISLKNDTELDILLGVNKYHELSTPIGLTSSERARHVYILGGTGSGKTTTLLYSITQDIKSGKGVAVLDPHGDLAETILRYIPEDRIKDVIYLNPDDLSHPIGINLLELSEGVTGDDLLREKDLITESTISVLRKIFSDDDSGGHRIEYILRNTIQTALTQEGSTLFTIFRILNDAKYRRSITRTLKDKDLKNFWDNELSKAGEFQRVKMSAGITAKIGRFLFSASAKRMLEQENSTIDFDNILDSGKILICNFSKGLVGEDTSSLFGTAILAKLQIASLRRARIKQDVREPFYLYVDEFQNFATMSFVQMLSEARKYKLYLTMAEQSTSQQDQQRLVDIILANVGTVMCFRSGSPADERYIQPLFSPYIELGEIANLPAYNFYIRISAVDAQEPMSGTTVLLDSKGSEAIAKEVISSSREQFAVKLPDEPVVLENPAQVELKRPKKHTQKNKPNIKLARETQSVT